MVSQEVSFMFSITIILEFKVEKQTEKEVNEATCWVEQCTMQGRNYFSHHITYFFSVATSEVKKQL